MSCPVGRIWLSQLRWAFGLAAALLLAGAYAQDGHVHLTIDYPDGAEKQFVLPFKSGMTVFDAVTAAAAAPHGITFDCDPKFPCSGSPPNRMLGRIDGLKNQGGGSSAKNWEFWVNGIYGDKGVGVCRINADDKVLWKFDVRHEQQPGKACR